MSRRSGFFPIGAKGRSGLTRRDSTDFSMGSMTTEDFLSVIRQSAICSFGTSMRRRSVGPNSFFHGHSSMKMLFTVRAQWKLTVVLHCCYITVTVLRTLTADGLACCNTITIVISLGRDALAPRASETCLYAPAPRRKRCGDWRHPSVPFHAPRRGHTTCAPPFDEPKWFELCIACGRRIRTLAISCW
jgi:hypothetical protein